MKAANDNNRYVYNSVRTKMVLDKFFGRIK